MTQRESSSDPIATTYANVVSMHLGPFDLIMDFGFKSPEDVAEDKANVDTQQADTESQWTPVARIAMSHAHAKSMLPILARMIGEFEKHEGEIPSPGFGKSSKE